MTTAGHVYRITAHLSWQGIIDIENVYYLQVASAGSDTDSVVLSKCAEWLDTTYQIINDYVWNQVNYVDVRGFNVTADSPIAPVAWPVTGHGNSSVSPVATGVSFVLTFYTLLSRVRGRKFIGGLISSQLSQGQWVGAILTPMVNFALAVMAGPVTLPGGSVLSWGLYRKGKPFIVPVRAAISVIPGYQRRRRFGTGS